jgi:hypothetical protein
MGPCMVEVPVLDTSGLIFLTNMTTINQSSFSINVNNLTETLKLLSNLLTDYDYSSNLGNIHSIAINSY